jgi:hypothetical protein
VEEKSLGVNVWLPAYAECTAKAAESRLHETYSAKQGEVTDIKIKTGSQSSATDEQVSSS